MSHQSHASSITLAELPHAVQAVEGIDDAGMVTVVYTNYRGETAVRQIVPRRIWFGSTEWHPEAGWLLDAYDIEKQAERSFSMADIKAWFVRH